MKRFFLFLLALIACIFPSFSQAAALTLEPYSKEQSIENFKVKQFVEYDPEDLSLLENPSATPLLVFSTEQKATQATSFYKKKSKPAVKILPLHQYLSSSLKEVSSKKTFLSLRYESISDAKIDEVLPFFVSSGGIVHIDHALNSPEGIEFIKSLSQKSLREDSSIHFILSGDGVILYSSTYHPVEVSPLLAACTESFLENVENEHLLKMEKTILSSISSKELDVFDLMEKPFLASQETVPLYPLLWKGLFFLEQKEYLEASRCFHKALASGVDHWRVYWYISLAETERRNYTEAKRALQHVLNEVPDFKEAHDLLERIEEV